MLTLRRLIENTADHDETMDDANLIQDLAWDMRRRVPKCCIW